MSLIPLIESFGPTIQGEGFLAGLPTLFLRFGLCDYRCVWCDSKYAVEPSVVKRDARRVTQGELIDEVKALAHWPGMWITLSGGNPAMHDLSDFVADARADGYLTSVETQGSLWRPWLGEVDHLTVSPKPPSSGMDTDVHRKRVEWFLASAEDVLPSLSRSLKIVVFSEDDYEWAVEFITAHPSWQSFLSVGTPSVSEWGNEVVRAVNEREVRNEIGDQYAWLCEKVAVDPRLSRTRVFPQLHVLAWGHSKGV